MTNTSSPQNPVPRNPNIKHGRIIAALRRVWLYSEVRRDCVRAAKTSRGKYKCNTCGKIFSMKEVQCDHKEGVGKFVDWNTFIDRLFCPIENLQVLCKACHLIKSNEEKGLRKAATKAKKKSKKK
jgi:5-methylcytosine-specific restriction endonuclease McrA